MEQGIKMDLQKIWKKADSLQGCLSHLRTTSSHRLNITDEDPLEMEDPFISDEAKLLSSKAYRVLGFKTQVFTFPKIPLIRNRLTHVMEVVACSVVTADLLGLNINLVRAAGIGHDIGHVPLGHQGEAWIAKAMGQPAFCHEIMGPIIAQKIERKGRGLNLTWHTLDAMMRHSGNKASKEMSQEAWVLRFADKFAYIFHDINDIVVRARYPASSELLSLANSFGSTQRERTTTAIACLVIESAEYGHVSFEHCEFAKKFKRLRKLMYDVYPRVTQQDIEDTMGPLFDFLSMLDIGDPFLLLALMTDTDAAYIASERMKDIHAFNRTAVSEIVPHLQEIGPIDLCIPDLDW